MKRVSMLLLVVLFLFTITGCSKVKLEENQYFATIKSNGDLVMSAYMSDKDAEDAFDIDSTDKESKIKKDLEDYFNDEQDIDVKVNKVKATKDYVKFTLTTSDAEDMDFDLDQTLEDYAEDYGYEDVDALAEDEEFLYFKNGDDVSEKDLADYEDNTTMSVYGDEEGTYYKFPDKILIVSDIDYERISSDTIFVDSEEDGIVILKK